MSTTAPSFVQSVWLVSEREVMTKLRSKSFLISTGILLLIVLASILIGGFSAQNASDTKIAAVGEAASSIEGVEGLDVTPVDTREAAERMVRDGDVEAAVVVDAGSPVGFEVIADTSPPTGLINQLSVTPPVTLLDEDAENPLIIYFVALGFGLVFFASAMTFGTTISQSVVEEKQTRVVEILMSAIPVRALLAGKVIGNSVLAFAQIAVIAALAIIGLTITGQNDLLTGLGTPIVWFVFFFIVGFILLAAMFAAAGAMVSRQEDIGSTTAPVTTLIMIPYFLVIFFNDNDLVMTIMSYVPFSAPVGMPVRLFLGDAQWWEPVLSLGILAVSTLVVIAIGARIYSNSLLRMGSRVKLREALRT
ncbi:ABC transporter permease [Okibacterium endophyticum]